MNTARSTDYINDWENTPEWNILATRSFRIEVDKTISLMERRETGKTEANKHLFSNNYEALKNYALWASLENMSRPNGYDISDSNTVMAYYRRKCEMGQIEDIHPMAHQYLAESMKKIEAGMNTDTAFMRKSQNRGNQGLDATKPPEYIYNITNLILRPEGMNLVNASLEVWSSGFHWNEEYGKDVWQPNDNEKTLEPEHMQKMFRQFKLFGYVNWRCERSIINQADDNDWTDSQKKYLKKYWGFESTNEKTGLSIS